MSKNILITSGRSPAGLDLARSFSASGHKVYIVESFKLHLCSFSRFAKSITVPSPRFKPAEYIQSLKKIISDNSIDLIIPVYEEIFTISKHLNEFEGLCEVVCDKFQLLDRLHNKYEFIEMCKEFGLSHPHSELLTKADEKLDYSEKVLKPVYSRFGTNVFIKPKNKQVSELNFSRPWVLQDFIEGKPYCAYTFCKNGKILACSIYPVEATLYGACISFKHEYVAEIVDWMTTFIQKSEVSGSISFDFILKESIVYPIECNPRVSSGIHLLLPESKFIASVLNQKSNSHPSNSLYSVSAFVLAKAFLNWSYFKTIFRSKDLLFKWNDPLPLFGQFLCTFFYIYLALKTGKSISEASTIDIEWNGEER